MDYQEIKAWINISELKNLLDLTTLPKHLYFSGTFNPVIFENCVAIVGSRKMTDYGQRAIEKIVPQIVAQKQTIISGFMYGVDQYAHKVCVANRGKTIAVLGWGINSSLGGEDLKLAKKIIELGGGLLSEWESQKPAHWTFPARNRIVASLSKQVIIVEAAENSGSLITARLALGLKRELWAVPGPITSKTSMGTNKLIAEGKAKMYLATFKSPQYVQSDPILQTLDNESLTTDELSRKLGLPISEVGAALSLLLLSGQILEKGGKYYINDAS